MAAEGFPPMRPVHPLRPWLIAAPFGVLLVVLAIRPQVSANVWSRCMAIESMVERGTQAVDGSRSSDGGCTITVQVVPKLPGGRIITGGLPGTG